MRILVLNNRYKEATEYMAGQLAARLQALGVEVAIDNGHMDVILNNPEIIIVLGGDGTILRAARQYGQSEIPILGVNMGTVGFLSNIEVNELEFYFDRLLNLDFTVDKRMMLEVGIYNDKLPVSKSYCLNEVVFKSPTPRMLSFILDISGQVMSTYRGDGLIIASSTGSTAYSLSAGGPVVDPILEAFVVTPIASHITSKRPLVVAPDRVLSLTPLECREAIICIDGQVKVDFEPEYRIVIRKAEHKLKLINLKKKPFYNLIDGRMNGK
ncbi:MAG: NAD(+)/NADH kinase [Syntrophomonadaceae bacterium]|nr:NAD(+)/NADH kinase [Syntrophomonadaceae bacterium]MDD3023265.1 NAD(+)/NADH kinase [Syntrophomonadaceae bacterium]